MAAQHWHSIDVGIALFFALGIVLALPLLVWQLIRHGRQALRRMLVIFTVLGYATVTLSLVFLPLPDPMAVCNTPQAPQFTPFQWMADIQYELAMAQHSGLLASLQSSAFLSFAFNIALFLPLGIIGRTIFRWKFGKTAAYAFGISLAIELTQLTGNWGMYACPYRLFDVDDLIANTTGSLLGWLIVQLFFKLTILISPHAKPVPNPEVGQSTHRTDELVNTGGRMS